MSFPLRSKNWVTHPSSHTEWETESQLEPQTPNPNASPCAILWSGFDPEFYSSLKPSMFKVSLYFLVSFKNVTSYMHFSHYFWNFWYNSLFFMKCFQELLFNIAPFKNLEFLITFLWTLNCAASCYFFQCHC